MGESGFHRFPGHLDPRAQEFYPTATLPLLPLQIYYPHPSPPPLPPPHMGYAQAQFGNPPQPPVYVTPVDPQPIPVALPPSSSTPTRTLILSMVQTDVSESTVRRELEVFGDVRAVQMERLREGVVTVHFYDVRDSHAALRAIQEQHMQHQCRLGRHYEAVLQTQNNLMPVPPPPLPPPARGLISGRVVWAQFTSPMTSALPDGTNQGTIVIFNLDPQVSATNLKEIFEAFGPVKELRETPNKKNQRFVEFYDVRNAAKAVAGMNGKEIYGKQIVIEFSRPGGRLPRLSQISRVSSTRNYWSRNSPIPPPSPPPPRQHRIPGRVLTNVPPRSYNSRIELSRKSSLFSGGSKSSSSGSLRESVASMYISGGCEESCNSTRPPSKKNSKKNKNEMSTGSGNGGSGSGANSKTKSGRWKSGGSGGGGAKHGRDYDPRFLINEDAIMESNCRDSRTTVMIKNIPNKYSQKLLLNMLDNHCIHCNEQIADGDDQPLSAYDFVYLPIDFINKCNVGYGFVNMTSPEATLRLYKAFHNQSWEVFNSRKICEVTYARLQGIEALREHFKNSKFPGDAEEYMPVLFSPPRDGLRLTEPMPIVTGGGFGGRSISSGSPPPLRLSSSSPAASTEESESTYDHNVEYSEDMVEVNSVVGHDYEVARDRSNPSNGGDSGGCSC